MTQSRQIYEQLIPGLRWSDKKEIPAKCPLHNDHQASLSINTDSGQWFCHACNVGGSVETLYRKVKGIEYLNNRSEKKRMIATHDYVDESGEPLFQEVRYEPKDFKQRRPDGNGGWIWNLKGVRLVPFNLTEVMTASTVFVVEGPKDCLTIKSLGLVATTNPLGAGKWQPEYNEHFKGKDVVILPDNDDPGRKHTQDVAQKLYGIAKSIKVVELPGLPEKGDISDWVKIKGNDKEKLLEFVEEAPEWTSAEVQGAVSDQEWPEPIPFNAYSLLPTFPTDAFPLIGQRIVEEVSEVNQVDTGLTASILLCILSTAAQKKFMVDLLTHKEPVNLYTCSIYESGNRKSSVMSTMTHPIYEYQSEIQQQARPRIEEAKNANRFKEARLQKLQKMAAQNDNHIERQRFEDEAVGIIKEMQENPVPHNPLLVVDDITPEALGLYMAENGEKLSVFSPEGGLFSIMAGLYNDKSSNIDLPLKAYSGDAWSSHRIGRESKTMQSPALTLGLAVQPEVIEEIGKNPQFRGKGLLARFQYSYCKSTVGYRERQKKAVPESLLEEYYKYITNLLQVPDELNTLRLTPEAHAAWDEFYNDVETSMRPGGDLEYLKDWGSKLPGAVARIAGLLHFAEYGSKACEKPISVSFVSGSCAIGSYYLEHAIATFGLMKENPKIKTAKTILSYIQRHKPETFKGRDILRNTSIEDMNIASEGLKILIERGYLRSVIHEYSGMGRPEAMTYEVNPKIKNVNV